MLLNTLHVIACITSITLYYILFHDCTYLFRLFWLFLLSQLLSDTLHHIDHGTACFLFRASMLLCVQFDGTIGAGLTLKLLERRLNNNFESYKGEDSQIFRGQHSCMMSMSCFVRQTFAHIHKSKGRRKLCKCPKFCGGRKVLASLQVILGQFLHEEAWGWFPSLSLQAPDELLTMQEESNPITQTWCLHSIDIAMITRWMPCAPVCIIQEEGVPVIRQWIRGTAVCCGK